MQMKITHYYTYYSILIFICSFNFAYALPDIAYIVDATFIYFLPPYYYFYCL